MKVTELGYELLFKVGDDPLQELVELDRFFKWSYRIRKLEGLFQRRSLVSPMFVYFLAVALAFSFGAFFVLVFQYLLG